MLSLIITIIGSQLACSKANSEGMDRSNLNKTAPSILTNSERTSIRMKSEYLLKLLNFTCILISPKAIHEPFIFVNVVPININTIGAL